MGASLALALRERQPGVEIRIWARREESLRKVLAMGLADLATTDAADAARGASLIIFCMPIGAMPAVAEQILGTVARDTLVTDVGSVKGPVVQRLGALFRGRAEFIGSHPMAGSEQSGIDAAEADLFDGAVTILTPDGQASAESVAALSAFWESVGSRVAVTTAAAHDEAVALISHLPHLAAAVLLQTVMRENPAALDWRGNGFLDTTRVASGPPAMWAEILMENREALKKGIHAMIENLAEVTKLLDSNETGAVEDYLAGAMQLRERLKQKEPKAIS